MNNVSVLRQRLNMTQDEFSEYCGVARISIARYEAGAEVSRANAKKIADACSVSIAYVLGETISTAPWDPDDMAWADKADEATRLMARGMARMSPENRQKLLEVARVMFATDFDEEGNKK